VVEVVEIEAEEEEGGREGGKEEECIVVLLLLLLLLAVFFSVCEKRSGAEALRFCLFICVGDGMNEREE